MVVLWWWWWGGAFVSSHSLDIVGSDELRKTAPLHCKGGGLSERDLRRGKPSVVVEICCRGAATSIQPACQSPRNTAAASVFFLVSSQLFMDVLAKI